MPERVPWWWATPLTANSQRPHRGRAGEVSSRPPHHARARVGRVQGRLQRLTTHVVVAAVHSIAMQMEESPPELPLASGGYLTGHKTWNALDVEAFGSQAGQRLLDVLRLVVGGGVVAHLQEQLDLPGQKGPPVSVFATTPLLPLTLPSAPRHLTLSSLPAEPTTWPSPYTFFSSWPTITPTAPARVPSKPASESLSHTLPAHLLISRPPTLTRGAADKGRLSRLGLGDVLQRGVPASHAPHDGARAMWLRAHSPASPM